MAAAQPKSKKTCGTSECPGLSAENEMAGVKALCEKVLAEVSGIRDTLAGTMERPGLIHQVRELSESQRATAAAVEKLTEVVRDLEQFKNAQGELNKGFQTGIAGSVSKTEVEQRAQTAGWLWKAAAMVGAAVSGVLTLWASIKGFKP